MRLSFASVVVFAALAGSALPRPAWAAPANFEGEIKVPEGYPTKENTVLWIDGSGEDDKTPSRPKTMELDQKKIAFVPHVLVVPNGSTIVFRNSDPFLHQIRAQGGPLAGLHLDMKKRGGAQKAVVKGTGSSELLCDIHAQMSAYVVSVDTPYFTKSDKAGHFKFAKLPPSYPWRVHVWHEVLPPQDLKIESDQDLAKLKLVELKAWDK